jgi:hypothetical protein
MSPLVRFAENLGITIREAAHLRLLCESAADAQVKEHNDGTPAEHHINYANSYAKRLGLLLDWNPGLYPHVVKDGQSYHLPD